MDIFASEIFGPATVIHPVDSTQAAIELANDTEYGLTGGVISRDVNAALDAASRVRSGIIHINDQGIADEPMAPFGGVKNSGYGKSALAAQPLPVQQMRAGELWAQLRLAQSVDRLAITALGVRVLAEQRPAAHVDPLPPVGLTDAGRFGQPV